MKYKLSRYHTTSTPLASITEHRRGLYGLSLPLNRSRFTLSFWMAAAPSLCLAASGLGDADAPVITVSGPGVSLWFSSGPLGGIPVMTKDFSFIGDASGSLLAALGKKMTKKTSINLG